MYSVSYTVRVNKYRSVERGITQTEHKLVYSGVPYTVRVNKCREVTFEHMTLDKIPWEIYINYGLKSQKFVSPLSPHNNVEVAVPRHSGALHCYGGEGGAQNSTLSQQFCPRLHLIRTLGLRVVKKIKNMLRISPASNKFCSQV